MKGRGEEDYGYWPEEPVPEDDGAWTPKEKKNLKILIALMLGVAAVCCGIGAATGAYFA